MLGGKHLIREGRAGEATDYRRRVEPARKAKLIWRRHLRRKRGLQCAAAEIFALHLAVSLLEFRRFTPEFSGGFYLTIRHYTL
jgi:hypothetical protein